MTQREYYPLALDLLYGPKQTWTPQRLATKLDCTTQRACALLRMAECEGVVKSFTTRKGKKKWILNTDVCPITIEWLTEREYFFSLSFKQQLIILIRDWLYE